MNEGRDYNLAERLKGSEPNSNRPDKKYDERKTQIDDLNSEQLQEFIVQLGESIEGIERQLSAAKKRDETGERPLDHDWEHRAGKARDSKIRLRDKCVHKQRGDSKPSRTRPPQSGGQSTERQKSFERIFYETAREILTDKQFKEIQAQANLRKEGLENPYLEGLNPQ